MVSSQGGLFTPVRPKIANANDFFYGYVSTVKQNLSVVKRISTIKPNFLAFF